MRNSIAQRRTATSAARRPRHPPRPSHAAGLYRRACGGRTPLLRGRLCVKGKSSSGSSMRRTTRRARASTAATRSGCAAAARSSRWRCSTSAA
jgi:hypothetical protein